MENSLHNRPGLLGDGVQHAVKEKKSDWNRSIFLRNGHLVSRKRRLKLDITTWNGLSYRVRWSSQAFKQTWFFRCKLDSTKRKLDSAKRKLDSFDANLNSTKRKLEFRILWKVNMKPYYRINITWHYSFAPFLRPCPKITMESGVVDVEITLFIDLANVWDIKGRQV